jgi:hypothetical protein
MVRPFLPGDTSPAQLALAPNEQVNANAPVVLFIGKTGSLGSLRMFNATYQQTVSLYLDEAIVEQSQGSPS